VLTTLSQYRQKISEPIKTKFGRVIMSAYHPPRQNSKPSPQWRHLDKWVEYHTCAVITGSVVCRYFDSRTVNRGTVNRGTIKRGQLIAGQLIVWTHNRLDN